MVLKEKDIVEALGDIIPADKIKGLHIDEGNNVLFSIMVDPSIGTKMEDLRLAAEQKILAIPSVSKVTVILTAEKPQPQQPSPPSTSASPLP